MWWVSSLSAAICALQMRGRGTSSATTHNISAPCGRALEREKGAAAWVGTHQQWLCASTQSLHQCTSCRGMTTALISVGSHRILTVVLSVPLITLQLRHSIVLSGLSALPMTRVRVLALCNRLELLTPLFPSLDALLCMQRSSGDAENSLAARRPNMPSV